MKADRPQRPANTIHSRSLRIHAPSLRRALQDSANPLMVAAAAVRFNPPRVRAACAPCRGNTMTMRSRRARTFCLAAFGCLAFLGARLGVGSAEAATVVALGASNTFGKGVA